MTSCSEVTEPDDVVAWPRVNGNDLYTKIDFVA